MLLYSELERDKLHDMHEQQMREMNRNGRELVLKIQELDELKAKYKETMNKLLTMQGKMMEKMKDEEVYIS